VKLNHESGNIQIILRGSVTFFYEILIHFARNAGKILKEKGHRIMEGKYLSFIGSL
jgi:hypothetical protein